MTTKVYEFKCKKCGKEIKSLNDKQFNFWKKQHELSHEVKNE